LKTALAILFGLIITAVSAALILPSFIDWNQYKSDITAQARKATGRELTIAGDISLTVLPAPALKVANVELANVVGSALPTMVSLKELQVEVALWPLLSGEMQVQSVRLIDPVISLEVDAQGRANWIFDTGEAGSDAAASGDGGPAAFSLDSLMIENGILTFVDASSGLSERIDGLTAEVSAKSLQGPFVATGQVTTHGLALGFEGSLGRLQSGQPLGLSLNLDIGRQAGTASIKGTLSQPAAAAEFKGKINVSGADAMALVNALAAVAKVHVDPLPGLKQAISLDSDISADADVVGLNNLSIKLGETTAVGAVNATLGAAKRVDVALDINRVDLDAWLTADPAETARPDPTTTTAADTPRNPQPFVIPADISGAVAVNINALTYRGSSIRQFEVSAAMDKGVVTVEKIAAHLPGGAAIDVVGTVVAARGLPRFEGAVRASADNLRGLLSWLGVDLKTVPQDRLRGASLSATLRSTTKLLEVYGIDLRLDSSKLTGGAAYAFRKRPAFSVDFAVDQFNVDAYLAPGGSPAAGPTSNAKDNGPALTALPPTVVETLNAFDTNIKVAVKKLNLNAVPISGVVFDVGLLGGAITVNDIHADDLGGATFSFKGAAADLAAKPRLNGVIDINAANATGLARLAGVTLPVPPARLGAVSARGKINGNAEKLDLDLTLTAAATTTALQGRVNLLGPAAHLDLVLKAANKSYVSLWRVFDPKFKPAPGGRDGALEVAGKLAGDLNGLSVDLNAVFGAAKLSAVGKISPLGAPGDPSPSYNLAFKAGHPDAPAFLQGLGIDYQPATTNLGALALTADIAGNANLVRVTNLEGNFGPVAMAGSAAADLGGRRPTIDAALATSEIFVDLFLPRGKSGAKSGENSTANSAALAKPDNERWSSAPIDLAVLNSLDLTLELQAKAITSGVYRFANPVVKATIKDGVANINSLTGKLFEGDVNLTAEVRDDQTPTAKLNISVSGGDIYQALKAAAGVDAVTGKAGFQGQFLASGHSQKAMISQLSGRASFAAENGVVSGVDLQRLSDRLKQLDRTMDFVSLINNTMSGGQTAYSRLGGNFNIQNGVARSDDLSATMQAGSGAGRATIDLPRWLIDMAASFRLTEHPNAPPVGVELRGLLDAPERNIKSRDMEAYVTQRVGGTVLRKLLGKKKGKLGALGDLLTGGGTQQPASPQPTPLQPIPQQPSAQQPSAQQPSTQAQPGSPPPPRPLLPQQPSQQPAPLPTKPKDLIKSLLKGLAQ